MYLYDLVYEPWHWLQLLLHNVVFQSFVEHTEVWLGQLDPREKVGDNALKQRHVLDTDRKWIVVYTYDVLTGMMYITL